MLLCVALAAEKCINHNVSVNACFAKPSSDISVDFGNVDLSPTLLDIFSTSFAQSLARELTYNFAKSHRKC